MNHFDSSHATIPLGGIAGAGTIPVPKEFPELLREMLQTIVKSKPCRSPELLRLQVLHDGDPDVIHTPTFFPKPAGMAESEWGAVKRLLVYVNLVKPAVRRIVSGCYGGTVQRTVEKDSPYKAQLEELFGPGSEYRQDSRCWFENATLFGTSARVWVLSSENEQMSWLPNPIYTHILANPSNLKEILGVFEFTPDASTLRFATAQGWGYITRGDGHKYTPADLGFLPATIGYGHDRTHRGELYGLSLVREAPDYSLRVSDVMHYLAVLQKIYSRAQMYVSGSLRNEKPEEAFGLHGIAELDADGKVGYASPDAKFQETLAVARQYIATLAIILSIPQDAFDASAIEPNQSAESAKMRNIPLSTLTKFLIEEWRRNEVDFARRGAALMQYVETGRRVTFSELRRAVRINVQMEPANVPEGKAEEVSAWTQLLLNGGKTPEDFARHFNDEKPEAELNEMAEWIRTNVLVNMSAHPTRVMSDGEQNNTPRP